ncbi:MAG: NADPH dehydrogenase NamA [Anaerolineae bacterium]|jgi:2,4-dienoyl-CoA reductase-like NADH-dependent reductase (Old Yellow Enzyme family)|nr:NADPH dehydrogenase NamA [Anaerolineae bacterium]
MPDLFSPLTLRDVTLRNRIVMSPMCMYSASNGLANDWHLGHYLARAVGGVGLLIAEATAVEARGRISTEDLGLWDDAHIEPLARIVRLVQAQGAAMAVQLAHAGRKAWSSARGQGPETAVAPSALPFDEGWQSPRALTAGEIDDVVAGWGAAAARALEAGFDAVEIHGAHGYLCHQFLSPLSNHRDDEYGGDLASRSRFLMRVVDAVRGAWPEDRPLLVRVSATDWAAGGLTPDDLVVVARELKGRGVDVIDCSSGGAVPATPPGVGPGYQVPFAEKIRREAGIATVAVGLIGAPELADEIVRNGRADLVALGRELLRNPYWPLDAAGTLGRDVAWPRQYQRARPC